MCLLVSFINSQWLPTAVPPKYRSNDTYAKDGRLSWAYGGYGVIGKPTLPTNALNNFSAAPDITNILQKPTVGSLDGENDTRQIHCGAGQRDPSNHFTRNFICVFLVSFINSQWLPTAVPPKYRSGS